MHAAYSAKARQRSLGPGTKWYEQLRCHLVLPWLDRRPDVMWRARVGVGVVAVS